VRKGRCKGARASQVAVKGCGTWSGANGAVAVYEKRASSKVFWGMQVTYGERVDVGKRVCLLLVNRVLG